MWIEVRETEEFSLWFERLPDEATKARVLVRVRRLSLGNSGDAKPVGRGIHELRLQWGPGYRIYYRFTGAAAVVLLCGGTKRTQTRDIRRAEGIARRLQEG